MKQNIMMKMAPKNVQKFNLIFSDLLEISTFGHLEICPKFWLKMLSNANK